MAIIGVLEAIWRHPIKGFTPEALDRVRLTARDGLPFDRVFAVENGPSGFDPQAPKHISKMKFAVLAAMPKVAGVRTRLDDAAGVLHASAPGHDPISVRLNEIEDAQAFADWLAAVLGEDANGPLRVINAPKHRFLDDPSGQISLTNLESLKVLSETAGLELSPARLRGNIDVSGWPAFAENTLAPGARVRLGGALATVVKPIQRCIATHVNPQTAERDFELVTALMEQTGKANLGVYLRIETDGDVEPGQRVEVMD